MKFWLTTHWPHPLDQSVDWNIYLQSEMRSTNREPTPGDGVAFFELQMGKQLRNGPRIPKGRRGIVAFASVTSALEPRPGNTLETHVDGTQSNWKWQARCEDHDWGGFVPWREVNRIMKYSPNATLFGFGAGSGLESISEQEFDDLLRVFRSTARE